MGGINDQAIRSRLLNRLGIYKSPPVRHGNAESQRRKHIQYKAFGKSLAFETTSGSRSVIGNLTRFHDPFQQPLNDDAAAAAAAAPSVVSSSFGPPGRRLRFESNVTVIPIASRHQFSNRIKRILWSNSREIKENAERNMREYEYEGWDWNLVLEDDEMYVDSNTGDLVHPVWLEEEYDDYMDEAAAEEEAGVDGQEEEFLELDGPSLTRTQSANFGLDGLST